jgi:hypothetical protein
LTGELVGWGHVQSSALDFKRRKKLNMPPSDQFASQPITPGTLNSAQQDRSQRTAVGMGE